MKAALLIICLVGASAHARPDTLRCRNLVLEGGGVRGIAYVGALGVLERRGVLASAERVGGTSVGAITALLLALGYNVAEMEAVLSDLRMQQLNDGRWFFVGGFRRFVRHYGWYRGERLERWLETLVARKTGSSGLTFADLHRLRTQQPNRFRDLYVTGTNLTTQQAVVFSHERTPYLPVATAVRISLSVPLYFGAVFLDEQNNRVRKPRRGQNYQILVDGGLTANYPLALFDSAGYYNPHTLGLKLERPEQLSQFRQNTDLAPYAIHSLTEYVGAFYNLIIENLNRRMPMAEEQKRTIYISTEGIAPRVRRLPDQQKQRLLDSGERAANLFLDPKLIR